MKNSILSLALFTGSVALSYGQPSTWVSAGSPTVSSTLTTETKTFRLAVIASKPQAQIDIQTNSKPDLGVTYSAGSSGGRTVREDWPFRVTYKISNLSKLTDATPSQKQVRLVHTGANHTSALGVSLVTLGAESPITNPVVPTGASIGASDKFTDGPTTYTGWISGKAGDHFFSAETITDTYSSVPSSLGRESVRVLPKTYGGFDFVGFTPSSDGKTSFTLSTIPNIEFKANNLFPGSMFFIQVYGGEPSATVARSGDIIHRSSVNSSPVSSSLSPTIISSSDWIPRSFGVGKWTVEFVLMTPVVPGSTWTSPGLSKSPDTPAVGGSKIFNITSGENDYNLAVGTYIMERGKPIEVDVIETDVIINATITTSK
jgi:hypothetical protein